MSESIEQVTLSLTKTQEALIKGLFEHFNWNYDATKSENSSKSKGMDLQIGNNSGFPNHANLILLDPNNE